MIGHRVLQHRVSHVLTSCTGTSTFLPTKGEAAVMFLFMSEVLPLELILIEL